MAQDRALTEKKLSSLWENERVKELETRGNKIVMFSDVHLGDGKGADDLRHNQKVLETALDRYKKQNYTVILLGDIEEFWQFPLDSIVNQYDSTIYKRFRAFEDNYFYRICGNHDSEWGAPDDPAREIPRKSEIASEALKLRDKDGIARILLVHGNQGSVESDKYSWRSRFFVRLYKTIEPIIKFDRRKSATKSQITKDYERILYNWAKNSKAILICGHSHRAIFASKSYNERLEEQEVQLRKEIREIRDDEKLLEKKRNDLKEVRADIADEKKKNRKIIPVEPNGKPLPCYFNTGCALYTSGITAIEIEDDEIRLVQWSDKNGEKIEKDVFKNCKRSLSGCIKEIVDR